MTLVDRNGRYCAVSRGYAAAHISEAHIISQMDLTEIQRVARACCILYLQLISLIQLGLKIGYDLALEHFDDSLFTTPFGRTSILPVDHDFLREAKHSFNFGFRQKRVLSEHSYGRTTGSWQIVKHIWTRDLNARSAVCYCIQSSFCMFFLQLLPVFFKAACLLSNHQYFVANSYPSANFDPEFYPIQPDDGL